MQNQRMFVLSHHHPNSGAQHGGMSLGRARERNRRNKVLPLDYKSRKGVHGCPVISKTPSERQLKAVLMTILCTDLGQKFRKTVPRNDANSCDANKVQPHSLPLTSVDSLEARQKSEPLHQCLNLSERIPRGMLTYVLGMELGRNT